MKHTSIDRKLELIELSTQFSRVTLHACSMPFHPQPFEDFAPEYNKFSLSTPLSSSHNFLPFFFLILPLQFSWSLCLSHPLQFDTPINESRSTDPPDEHFVIYVWASKNFFVLTRKSENLMAGVTCTPKVFTYFSFLHYIIHWFSKNPASRNWINIGFRCDFY